MDTEQIYVVQVIRDGKVEPFPDLMRPLSLVAELSDMRPTQTHLVCGLVSRGWPERRSWSVGKLVSDMGTLGFEFEYAVVPGATVRFLPLTIENFAVFKGDMTGWDDLAARFPTTEQLRWYFREQLTPAS